MTGLACMRARVWIDGRATGLDEPDRLRLEDHLAGCVRCAADADALGALRTLVETALPAGSDGGRERALRRAFVSSALAPTADGPATSRVSLLRPVLALGFAAAATAALVLVLHPQTPSPEPRTPPVATRVATTPRASLLAGSLRAQGGLASPGAEVRAGVELTSVGESRLRLGPAELTLADESAFRWEPEQGIVRLRSGELHAQVEPLRRETFRVATDRFVVVVTGTRFSVTPERVDVQEGSVRVEALDGHVLMATLGAGTRWNALADSEATASDDLGERRGDPRWLAEARRRLATGDVEGARDAIARARPSRLARAERAEAETLRAECAQVEGKLRDAQRRYLRIAERHRDLAAGDNALFAAAKIAALRGDRTRERRLLERYLVEHPRGRFRLEANRRLSRDEARE